MLKSLDGAAVRRWAATCCDELAAHRDEIDELNVFPVADQDTGSNLLATMQAGLEAVLRDDAAAAGSTAAALARGALVGARGNSGVIVSQVLRGLSESLTDVPEVGGAALREGLCRAEELATAAVSEPVAGTVLTVLHAAAQGAARVRSDDLCAVASAAATAAATALADTPRQLAALARAGVVDAGGQGLVLLLEALLAVVTERSAQTAVAAAAPARPAQVLRVPREAGSLEYEYEVMYLLDGTDESRVAGLRAELGALGDCVALVGSGDWAGGVAPLWNVHVHCADVGAAIEAGVRAGRPHRITVLRFADQTGAAGEQARFITRHAVLAMVSGAGVVELLRGEGAATVPATCSVTELVAALAGSRARHVTVLPGRGAAARVAEAAAAQARDAGQDVVVVPAASPVQALAALAVHDGDRRPADDLVAMTEAAVATRRGELIVAGEEALTWVGRCQPGDPLGLVDDEVVLIGRDVVHAALGLVDRMLAAGGELVTVLLGRQAPDDLAEVLAEYLRTVYPEVEAVVYQGGQPDSVLLVGVE
ncbi:MAG: DAK2 domain-containing protein [Pseudonocardiaceae bacterium]